MEYPGEGPGAKGGLSAFRIRRHLEGSLSRLQTDHIDLYQMHHVDPSVTWEELWEAFEVAVGQGKIGYVGSSNFAGWHIVEAQAAARSRNFLGLVSEQHRYNLVCRLPELEVLPAARHLGIGVIPYSPLGGGLLGGDVLNPPAGSRRATEGMRKAVEKHRPQLEKYASFCRGLGEKEADVALAWLLANPAVAAPIVGPRTLGQLQSTLRSLQIKLDEDALAKLDEIFPGPGGEAPEAYAPQGQLLRPTPVSSARR
jgi:aryl-alcohol dehydrogenase-like predicted oxidoreductase